MAMPTDLGRPPVFPTIGAFWAAGDVRGRRKGRYGVTLATEDFDGHAEARSGGKKGGARAARKRRDGH